MTIAIVDAYSQPYIHSDVDIFSELFGLPEMDGIGKDPTLTVLVPPGQSTPPPANTVPGNWGYEISLDVEWVHSIARYANIDLITTQDNSGDSLYGAEIDGQSYSSGVGYAKSLPGVVVVSNSYGSGEFNGETDYDSQFTTSSNNVAFDFSTGDYASPVEYPSASPNVVAVGGTSLHTLSINGRYGSETGWSLNSDSFCPTCAGVGGISQFESTPSYQSNNGVNNGARSVPDVSWLADPNTGVFIIDSTDDPGSLIVEGGTSLAAPMWAGLIALGDEARGSAGPLSSTGVLDTLYGAYDSSSYSTDFHDITTGYNGYYAGAGYDLVTGIGSPKAPAIATLLGAASPGVVIGGGPTSPISGRFGALDVDYSRGTPVGNPISPIAIDSVLAAGAVPDFLTTMDIPKPKKIGGLLSS